MPAFIQGACIIAAIPSEVQSPASVKKEPSNSNPRGIAPRSFDPERFLRLPRESSRENDLAHEEMQKLPRLSGREKIKQPMLSFRSFIVRNRCRRYFVVAQPRDVT